MEKVKKDGVYEVGRKLLMVKYLRVQAV